MQTAVYGGLHAAAVDIEVRHGAPINAVLLGGQRLHVVLFVLAVGIQAAALGIDGCDQLRLALVLEAAQRGKGAVDNAGSAALSVAAVGAGDHADAVVDAAAPEHILERNRVVAHIEAGKQRFYIADQLGILCRLPEILLRLSKLVAILLADLLPLVFEVGAEAGIVLALGIVRIGVVELIANTAVGRALRLCAQPVHEALHGRLYEHIYAVGGAAAVLIHGGDAPRVGIRARLVVLAQGAQFRISPILAGGQQDGGHTTGHHHRCQDQCHAPFCPFHAAAPCLISKLYGNAGGGQGPLHRFT